jgi:hypothetical protein
MNSYRKEINSNVTWRNKDGILHREDGPAIELTDRRKQRYRNNRLHRIDGPAVEYPKNSHLNSYYLEGDCLPKEVWEIERFKYMKNTLPDDLFEVD